MGTDKALLRYQGKTLIERLVEELSGVTDEVWISANEAGHYLFLGREVIPDLYHAQGPMSGIHAAMTRTRRPQLIVLACDLPGVRESLIRTLLRHVEGHDAVVPRTAEGRPQPLCGVYRRTCLPMIEEALASGRNKIRDLLEAGRLRVKWLDGAEGGFRDEDLLNLNSPEDFSALLRESG